MSKTITWEWFKANRQFHRWENDDGRVFYFAFIELDGREYGGRRSEYLPDADDNLIRFLASVGYTVDGYTPPEPSPKPDPVNNPAHYKQGGIECIEAIQAALTPEEFRGYCKGNALKYIWRSEHKGKPEEDLQKAVWYLERLGGNG